MTTPLFTAVESCDLAGVNRLLERNPGIDMDVLDNNMNTALNKAIMNDYKPIIEVLLARGAAVNGPVGAYYTPLQQACSLINARSRLEIASLLLEHGADVDAIAAVCRRTPLTIVCFYETKLGLIQLLLNAGADVNGSVGRSAPLHKAALFGNIEAIDLLIQSGADVNILSTANSYCPPGSTPLHFAATKEDLSCLNLLLAAGADPNIANSDGQTPLYPAALWSSVDVVNALLTAGCDPLHQDNDGRTPLQTLYARYLDRGISAEQFNIITALVAAGDRSWECVPTPCPGLEAAMLSVWQNAPDELPQLVQHMENPPQTLIELFPRMDEEMKQVVQEVLRGLHHHFAGFSEVREQILNSSFGFGV